MEEAGNSITDDTGVILSYLYSFTALKKIKEEKQQNLSSETW